MGHTDTCAACGGVTELSSVLKEDSLHLTENTFGRLLLDGKQSRVLSVEAPKRLRVAG